jgi:hypothetical protein
MIPRLFVLLLSVGLCWQPGLAAERADFRDETPSTEARHVADWAAHSGDHGGRPFVIVDKRDSRVFVFDGKARLRGAASALLGMATGDTSVRGIGSRKLSTIRPEERTTPAGRFLAALDRNAQGDEILWVDYESAVALHRVVTAVARERRLERLASNVAADRRITYGCINVPVTFFLDVVAPGFRESDGIVYVLPETRPAREIFGSYDVAPAIRPTQ